MQEEQEQKSIIKNKKLISKKGWLVIVLGILVFSLVAGIFSGVLKTSGPIENNYLTSPEQLNSQSDYSELNDEIITYFYATGCHYCQNQTPIVDELNAEGYKIIKINVAEDAYMKMAVDLLGVPAFKYQGQTLLGLQTKEELIDWIGNYGEDQ